MIRNLLKNNKIKLLNIQMLTRLIILSKVNAMKVKITLMY